MNPSLRWALGTLGLTAAGIGALLKAGSDRWQRSTSRAIHELLAERTSTRYAAFDPAELEGLPAPVIRYFRHTLSVGQAPIRSLRLTQQGEFRLGPAEDDWKLFRATQHFNGNPPGFVWDARIRLAPGLSVRVRDAYVGGQGSMRGELLFWKLIDEHDRPELDDGALQRYLAESVWLPTVLLPGRGVRWTAIDESSALATLSDSGREVFLEFRFDGAGEIVEVFAPERYREVDGEYVPTPWRGRFRNYQLRSGIRVPLSGEVEWILPEGPLPYWRGRIVDFETSAASS